MLNIFIEKRSPYLTFKPCMFLSSSLSATRDGEKILLVRVHWIEMRSLSVKSLEAEAADTVMDRIELYCTYL